MLIDGVPSVSVIISTLDRAEPLRKALEGLRRQTFPNFEVVIVNGPSADGTQAVLDEYASDIRTGCCPERSVAASRNVGISLAQGEILAFTDDDAVPDPKWIENLVVAYRDPALAGVGGSIFEAATGRIAYGICVCTRAGDVSQRSKFSQDYVRPDANPVFYLTGGNMSFRRSALSELGGFDERYVYGYEDVDVCCRLIDAGKRIAFAPEASIYHYPAANVLRDSRGVYRDLYPFVQARVIFALRQVMRPLGEQEAMARLDACVLDWRNLAGKYLKQGVFDQAQYDHFLQRLSAGIVEGRAIAKLPPKIHKFPAAGNSEFRPFR